MTRWMRRLHKWFGLVLALQFVLWMASGLIMSLLDHAKVQGHHRRADVGAEAPSWPKGAMSPARVLADAATPLRAVEASWLRDRPVYRLSTRETTWLVDAMDGRRVHVDSGTARAIATTDYAGPGRPGMPVRMQARTLEVRDHAGPIWRVAFDDEDHTTLYVSGLDGSVLERRNDAWRLFDIVWMLHIMDYSNRDDFNNPLVVTAAAGGLWIALTGAWLLVASVRLRRAAPSASRA